MVTGNASSLWTDIDVGYVGAAGRATVDATSFTVSGAGSNDLDWNTADGFHFVYQPLNGDGTIVARITSQDWGTRAGVMIRETLDGASANALTVVIRAMMTRSVRSLGK